MMGQPNQMQGMRPGSYVANNQQRMPSPMSTGMGSPQHQPVQQRQPYPQQHQPMPNQNPQQPQQAPMSTPSILSSSLSGSNTQNLNQNMNPTNNPGTMGANVGNSSTSMTSNNIQQTPPTNTNASQPQTSTPSAANNGATATQQPSQPPATTPNPINTATVCKIGQETVQEIVGRTQEVFSYLKSLQPPVGNADKDKLNLEKQQRLAEVLKGITHLFKRLTFCWNKAQEHGMGGMEYTQLESLIPLKDDHRIGDGMKLELEKKRGGDAYRQALDENNELSQQLMLKNRQLKDIIDQIRNIIWEINTMLAMR